MPFDRVFIDARAAALPAVERICARVGVPVEVVEHEKRVYDAVSASADPVSAGKRVLYLTRNRGRFIRRCPGTRHYTCCGYKILHIGTYCTLDCAYCILQVYFHPPVLRYFVNHADLLEALNRFFSMDGIHRIGTGEFTDSLIWEPWTDLTERIIPMFADQNRAVLELKTKTVAIDQLQHLRHHRKTIAAWSVNTPRIIATQERGTAALSERLNAAAESESWGYPVAFHFDPMILYDGCRKEYLEVVDQIFSHVSARNIVWISMGAFRFMPSLHLTIQSRFPDSKILYGEFIPGLDGKMRYFKPLRTRLYRAMAERIRQHSDQVTVYLCMEDDGVWQQAFGYLPSHRGGLSAMLDRSAQKVCGLAG